MSGLLKAMFNTSEASIRRIWRLLRHLFQRLKSPENRDAAMYAFGIAQALNDYFRYWSAEDGLYVRTRLIACGDRDENDLTWEAVQTPAHEAMAEVGRRWISRPFDSPRRRKYLVRALLGDDHERLDAVRAIEGLVARFFGDPELKRVRAIWQALNDKAGASISLGLRDVLGVLMDGAPHGEICASHPTARSLYDVFERD